MQKTNFPFVCIIIDDASTDGEQGVILDYLKNNFELGDNSIASSEETDDYIFSFARHNKNSFCYFAVWLLKQNHYSIGRTKKPYYLQWQNDSEYVATCEGDDYWTDPYKLQKQADALDCHPECSICLCKVNKVSKEGKLLGLTFPMANHIRAGIVSIEDFLVEEFSNDNWCFQTSSFFFRSDLLFKEDSKRTDFFSHFHVGDLPILLWALLHGDGFYIDEIGGCYRAFSGGFTTYRVTHKEWAIKNTDKWQSAYSYIDQCTNYIYHKHISRKSGFKQLEKYFYQGKTLQMLNVRFWWQYYRKPVWLIKLLVNMLPSRFKSNMLDLWYKYKYKKRIKDMSADANFCS